MYKLLRPLLWTMDAERAHDLALSALHRAGKGQAGLNGLQRLYRRPTPALQVNAFGLTFSNCIGLAAGLDKNARGLPALAALGFGFLEVGTVTPRPQAGNPRPRMWRLPKYGALINRLGFNNEGAVSVRDNLTVDAARLHIPLGINIGKNATTPLEDTVDDYRACIHELHQWADYVVVNVSSPNTPGLRSLQHAAALDELLGAMRYEIDALATHAPEAHGPEASAPLDPGRPAATDASAPSDPDHPDATDASADEEVASRALDFRSLDSRPLPLLVKVAPDLVAADLDDIAEACLRHRIDGIIATNTTIRRDGIEGPRADEAGGLSGAPLTAMSNHIVAALYRRIGDRIPIVGVGGIMNAEDAYAKIKAGATLVQVLTGFVYEGPGFPRRLATGLQALLERDGFGTVQDAVGIEAERYPEPDAAAFSSS